MSGLSPAEGAFESKIVVTDLLLEHAAFPVSTLLSQKFSFLLLLRLCHPPASHLGKALAGRAEKCFRRSGAGCKA